MHELSRQQIDALRYVTNTGETATVANFDDDHDPIGPMLRRVLMPDLMAEDAAGKLRLTPDGKKATAPAA